MKKKILYGVLTLIIIVATLWFLGKLLTPKYMSGVVEGAFLEEYYYDEEGYDEKDHDVIFLGDCEVYGNFDPMVLWQEYGINSYIRGTPQQLTWQSYYILEDTLRYETPDVVVYTVSPLKHGEPQSEAYNRMSLDGLEWSMSKWNAIQASMLEEETILDYIFPLLRYHSRWDELETDDFTYLFNTELVSQNGYLLRVDVNPVTSIPDAPILADYELPEESMEYLSKITELCKENDIELVLIKAPSVYPYWYEEWDEQVIDFAEENDVAYLNFINLVDEIGIDYDTDTYDTGLHLNLYGAEKLTSYLGNYLVEEYGLENRQSDETLSELWEIKYERYLEEIEEQKELYGID